MNNIIEKLDENLCYGCSACAQSCPRQAINMQANFEGFLYPKIDNSKCIQCGICIKHCPAIGYSKITDKLDSQSIFAAKAKDNDVLMNSSSGGIFPLLATSILRKGGVVFGCRFEEKFKAEHIYIEYEKDLPLLLRSKYVASDIKNCYTEAKKILEEKRSVLFSGTPCQIAGLRSFLSKDYTNLITVDLICHGVPSQKLFSKYISWLEKKMKGEIIKFEFRNKDRYGWKDSFKAMTKNKVIHRISYFDPYFWSFLSGLVSRESCYTCPFSSTDRIGDLSLGDYWGIEKAHPEFDSTNGVSLVIVSTNKGLELFNSIKQQILFTSSVLEKAKEKLHNLKKPTQKHPLRKDVYFHLDNMDFDIFQKKYLESHSYFWGEIRNFIKSLLPEKLISLYRHFK